MSAKKVKVGACTTLQLAQTNCAFVSPKDFANSVKYVKVLTTEGLFDFSIKRSKEVPTGSIWLNQQQRKWAALSLDQHVNVCPFIADTKQPTITTIELEAKFYKKKKTLAPYDSDHMSLEFLGQFRNRMISVGERFIFGFQKKKPLVLTVKSMEGVIAFPLCGCEDVTVSKIDSGVCNPNAIIIFNKAEGSCLNLAGKYTGEISDHSIIIRDWDWQNMGIGGLDRQINAIFRQAFLPRIVPPKLLEPLGYKHVKGILLKGVPGTGKTILAVQIAKMMNSRKPKLFNACDISKRYLGESKASIREIFFEAQEEEKEFGNDSGLHLLILDDIDFFRLKQYSTVFNEFLSQIDSLNNILVIWTNRKYLVDKAFLYPGRIELQIELGLPNKSCRAEILEILTARMMEKNRLSFDVNLYELAELTENFTGADIQGLISAAQARALAKVTIQKTGEHTLRVVVDREVLETLKYCRSDFIHALETRNKQVVGSISNAIERLEPYLSAGGIISWGAPFQSVFDDGLNLIQEAHCGSGLVSVLLEGLHGAGKTAIAAQLVKISEFPFIQICSPINIIDMSDSEKCAKIRQVFDHAYSSELSCIFIDNIELILGYTRIGPIYSKAVLETLLMLLNKEPPKGHKLLVICTSSRKQELEKANILPSFTFTSVLHVPNLTTVEHLVTVLNKTDAFSESQIVQLTNEIGNRRPCIGIKQLLHIVDMTEFKNMDKRVNYFLSKLEKLESVLSHPN